MKRKVIARKCGGKEAVKQPKERVIPSSWISYALLTVISTLIPQTTVYGGLSPFGVSVTAAVRGIASIPISIGAAVGYLLAPTTVMPLRYIAALICTIGFHWAFGASRKIVENPMYAPLLAAGASFISGVAMNSIGGFRWDIMVAELCESILAGGFAFFFKHAWEALQYNNGPRTFDLQTQASITIVGAVLLMSVNTVMIHSISVGRVLTMMVILLSAKAGQQQGGTLSGVVMGAATAFCMPSYAYSAASYAFGGLLSGLFARFGRLACAFVFLLVHVLVAFTVGDADQAIIGIYEAFASAALFMVLPSSIERTMNKIFSQVQTVPAVEGICRSVDMRLTYASDTLKDIAQTVDNVSGKLATLNAPDMKEVYTDVCEHLCNTCSRRSVCWEQEFTETMSVFREMGQTLKTNGVVCRENIDHQFKGSCRHLQDVLSLMNHGYSRYILKETAFRRLSDIRSIVTDQFNGMAVLLSELSEDFRKTDCIDPQAAARVEQVCERYRIPIVQCVCWVGRRNRLTVELLVEGEMNCNENSRWVKEIGDICGCEISSPAVMKSGMYTKVLISERNRYQVRFGSAQLNCGKEKLCGDAFEQFYDHEGRCCLVLSDGMGTGGRAAVDGAMTAALAGRMMQAGFSYNSILRIINSALIIKSGDESLSTLDAVQIDLYTGYLRGLKAGAANSYLYNNGHLTQITSSSLPIGILRDIDAQEYEEYITFGDIFVMVSDGVVSDDAIWLEELICQLAADRADETEMANEIVFRARERQEAGKTDDTTALVLRIA